MRALCLALAVTLAGCTTADFATTGAGVPPRSKQVSTAGGALQSVNAERRRRGLPALRWDGKLARAASGHAADMATNRYFSHKGRDGSALGDRLKRSGFVACFGAENIAVGQTSVEQVMREWMQSRGHRRNILDRRAEAVGVARADGDYWVMVLGAGC